MSIRADEYFSAFELVGSACLGCYRSEKYESCIDASIKSFLKMIDRTPFGLEATKRLSSGHTVKIYVQARRGGGAYLLRYPSTLIGMFV